MSDSGKAYEWVDKQDQAALKASPRVLAAESYLAGITSRDAEVESLQAELAEARAVIEQVGAEATRHSEVVDGCVRVETAYVTQVLSAYRAAPSSALDAVERDSRLQEVAELLDAFYHGDKNTYGLPMTAADWLRARAAVLREKGERQ